MVMALTLSASESSRTEGRRSFGFRSPVAIASLTWSVTCLYMGSGWLGDRAMNKGVSMGYLIYSIYTVVHDVSRGSFCSPLFY